MQMTDFSKPILLENDEKIESSDDDEGFVNILPEMQPTSNDVDYDAYKEFYAEEIDGKMHWRQAIQNLEKAKKRAKLGIGAEGEGDQEGEAPEEQKQEAPPAQEEQKEVKEETEEEKAKRVIEERRERMRLEKEQE